MFTIEREFLKNGISQKVDAFRGIILSTQHNHMWPVHSEFDIFLFLQVTVRSVLTSQPSNTETADFGSSDFVVDWLMHQNW